MNSFSFVYNLRSMAFQAGIAKPPLLLCRFMRKKPEYRAACGGDEWQTGVWGQSPQDAFSVKRYPAACGGVIHFGRNN